MGAILTIPNIRVSSDLTIRLKLKDGGVAIDWSTLQNIRVSLYADDQRSMASRCGVSIDEEDSTILVCQYAANKMQYLGVNRVIVQCKYMGEVKTYDKPAFNFVRWTSDQEGEQITIDDPDVDVEISVEDVSSSILQEAVDAAFGAADRANEAAEAAEHMVDIHTGPEGKSAYEVAVEEGYTGTEEEWLASLKGPVGETPDISIGTVTTVEPGTPAAASMTGTPEAPVLNLSIPKGLVGATPNFTVGTVTTGEPGSSVIVTITGTPEAPVLNLTIPQGMQGNTGSSVEYPYELVNNLTTNDATKGLSAAQGYVLDGKVSQLEAKAIKLVGYGATGSSAGATNIGDIFYNTSTKVIRKKTGASTWETIPYEDGAIYTMGGKLWIWNGADLVELPTPDYLQVNNIQRDNAIKSSITIGDLLYGLSPKVGYYIDDSGVETASTNTEYFTINLPAQYGYIFFRPLESGFASVIHFLIFADISGNVLGYNGVQGNKGIQTTSTVGEWVCEALPSGTRKIYAMFVPGKERVIQLTALFPLYGSKTNVDYTNAEIFVNDTTMNLRTNFTSVGALKRSNTLRSTVPIKVNVGDVIRVSGYSTESLPPSSTAYKLNAFGANMQYIGSTDFETDPYDYTVPSGVSYVSFLIITDALSTTSIKKIAVGATSPKILADAVQKNSMWEGKIWAGLGDSLTAQSSSYTGLSWSPMVEAATGLVFKNCGIGSTALAGDGANAFWKRLSAVEGYNPDIVTILGGANDLYLDIPIGTDAEYEKAIADKDCTTFKGAYSYIVETLLTWKKTLRLVLLTTSYAHNDGADHTPGIGLTYKDYANATLSVAEYYGLPVVDLYRNMGINKLTQGTTYTQGDKIHWNARSSQIVASLVIAKLEEINNAVPTE